MILEPSFVPPELQDQFRKTLIDIKSSDQDVMDAIDNLEFVDKWDSNMAIALLSGKLFSRGNKNCFTCEFDGSEMDQNKC